jgi:cytochrome oxidase assembly protein ShyY1
VAPGERTLLQAMVRPRSIVQLLAALAVALTFAALGQWQLSRAVQAGTVVERATETVRPLSDVAHPQSQQTDASVGQLVRATGHYVPADFLVVADRLNGGARGYWVVGHAVLDHPAAAQLAVGLGWAPDRATAERAAGALRAAGPAPGTLTGRYIDSDPAEPSASGSPLALRAVSTAQLLNLWSDPTGPVYAGVLTLRAAPAGLSGISSPRPQAQVELNLLNLFYALEWGLFAVIAFYVWYRLIRDRWEQERAREEAAEPVPAAAPPPA